MGKWLSDHRQTVLQLALIILAILILAAVFGRASDAAAECRYRKIVAHGCQNRDPQPWCWGRLGVNGH
jgi:hypothetical protein